MLSQASTYFVDALSEEVHIRRNSDNGFLALHYPNDFTKFRPAHTHLGFDLLRANFLSQGLTYGIKVAVRRDRPTGECCSFPSGHASLTFATASVLERHFGYRNSWPMFVIAGYVAASRLTDNRHFLSDVLFGSALGMASGWTVVGSHGRENFALFPVPIRGGVAVSGTWAFQKDQ